MPTIQKSSVHTKKNNTPQTPSEVNGERQFEEDTKPILRVLADTLTVSRIPLAASLVYIGARNGAQSLPLGVGLMVFGWTADTVDGHLAKLAGGEGKTVIGRNDVAADVVFSLGSLAYFCLVDLVPVLAATIYAIIAALMLAFFPSRTMAVMAQIPAAALLAIAAFAHSLLLGLAVSLWAFSLLVLDRHRLRWRLGLFLEGIPNLFSRK